MPKTGSTAIQKTFRRHAPHKVIYPEVRANNHSALYALMFHEPVESFHRFAREGLSRPDLLKTRQERMQEFIDTVQADEHDLMILSSETISNPDHEATRRMAAFLTPLFSDIQVIAYVRPPVSLMQSLFQQRLKGGTQLGLSTRELLRLYRPGLEKLDNSFGRENVTIRKFHPTTLTGGDVVRDFADWAGVEMADQNIERSNISLSLEATALLFVQRTLGEGFRWGFAGAHRKNSAFIKALSAIGSQKLAFSPELVKPPLEKRRDDLDWIEARLGQPLRDQPRTEGQMISSEDDLLAIARENSAALEALLGSHTDGDSDGDQLLRNLEILRKMHY